MESRLEAALRYHDAGLSVVPGAWPIIDESGVVRCACGRAQCASPGKHPLVPWAAYQRSRASRQQLIIWWRRWPSANVCVVTGAISGLVVIDVDPAHGGEESLADIEAEFGPLDPAAPRVLTGGGGLHIWMSHPGGEIPSRTGWRPGVDIRADGGQVVAPPSLHASGQRYEFEATAPFEGTLKTKWNPAMVASLREGAQIERLGREPIDELIMRPWPQGERNANLTRAAGWVIATYADDPAAVLDRVLAINQRCCQPPLSMDEVLSIIRSLWKREREHRQVEAVVTDGESDAADLTEDEAATLTPSQRSALVERQWAKIGLDLPVHRTVGYEAPDGVEWAIVLADGREVSIGSDILSQTNVRRALANALGRVIPPMERKEWEQNIAKLVRLVERVEALPPGNEQAAGWIEMLEAETLDIHGALPDGDRDLRSASEALVRQGVVVVRTVGGVRYRWVALGRLMVWIDVRHGVKLHQRTLATWMRQAGWEPATWNDDNGNGWRVWRKPFCDE